VSPEDIRKVGGSDVAAIMGLDPYKTALSVWTRIVHGVETPDNHAMRRGRALESGVLRLYEEETGRNTYAMRSPLVGLPEHFRASLDGVSCVGKRGPGVQLRVVEVKTAGRGFGLEWGEPGTEEVPDGYALQVQWYLGWGLRVGRVQDRQADMAALLAGDFALYHVHFDPEVFGVLQDRAARFWRDHVETGRPPEVAPTTQDAGLVRRIRRDPGIPPLDYQLMDPRHQRTARRYAKMRRNASKWLSWAERAETELKLAVAAAGGIRGLPSSTGLERIDWNTRKGRTITDWEAVAREMAADNAFDITSMIARHTKTSEPTRAWCPKPLKGAEE
jgi:putative phage-type endonuclease